MRIALPLPFRCALEHPCRGIDVPVDEMAAKAISKTQRVFDVHHVAGRAIAERAAPSVSGITSNG